MDSNYLTIKPNDQIDAPYPPYNFVIVGERLDNKFKFDKRPKEYEEWSANKNVHLRIGIRDDYYSIYEMFMIFIVIN